MANIEDVTTGIEKVKEGFIDMTDVLGDMLTKYESVINKYEQSSRRKDWIIGILIISLVVSLSGMFVYAQWNLKEFMSQYDIQAHIEQNFDMIDNSTIADSFKVNQK